jgi:predicted RNase H-like HicB family nuclease
MSYRVYTAYDDQCNTIMGTELTNCIEQGKDPQQALTDAQKTAESQIVIKS